LPGDVFGGDELAGFDARAAVRALFELRALIAGMLFLAERAERFHVVASMAKSFQDIRNELLPALASDAWGLDPSATIVAGDDELVVRDDHEVGFVFTRKELEDNSYKREFNPRLTAWRDRRRARQAGGGGDAGASGSATD
jgi:ribosomal protein L24E